MYRITQVSTGRFYVGSSNHVERRIRNHCRQHSGCKRLVNAIAKYGWAAFRWDIVESLVISDFPPRFCRLLLAATEQFYLSLWEPFGDRGFNISTEADAPRDFNRRPHTPCLRLAISAGLLGKRPCGFKAPGKSKQMMGNKLRQGKPWSNAERARISAQVTEFNKMRPRGVRGRWTRAKFNSGSGIQSHNGL